MDVIFIGLPVYTAQLPKLCSVIVIIIICC